jgi:hypothetical protein
VESEEIFVDSEEDQDNFNKKRPQPVFIKYDYEAEM